MADIYGMFYGPDVKGDSKDNLNPEWIEIDAISVGFMMPTTGARSGAGSATSGKVNMGDFTFQKNMDTASLPLKKHCWSGTHFTKINFKMYRSFESGRACYIDITLEDAVIGTETTSGMGGLGIPSEGYTINYGKLFVKYTPTEQGTGKPSSNTITAGYNRITNKAS